jgi:signal transduction histidine kinase/FixJ family two-component response regulator
MKLAQLVAWTYDMASGLFTFDDTYYALHGTTAKLEGGNLMSAEVFTREFVHPDDAHVVAEEIGKAVAASDPDYHSQLEHRIFRRGGEIRHVIVHIAITKDAAGRTIQIQGANQDITERKRLEAQLFQSQKMETVGKLAGGVAHEFNSILTAIIGQSELLLNDLPAGSPLFKNATEINRAADRAAALTRQLLAYGRKQMLQPESLDLNQVVAGMEGMFRHLMGGDVVTHVVAAPGLRAVKADAGQVEQVIMNLAMNARDAMPNGGQLTLETANISFDKESVERYPELKAGDYMMLAVTDTGAGMSEKVKARVFEPFFTTKEVGQGSGLGLSTCYGIIKQSGGHISVYSEPGRGATFKVYLPQMAPEAKIHIQSLAAPDMPRGTETILLVEDDPALREMAATLLGRLGYKVWSAANGIEALSLKQQQGVGHIDLLFTDVVMPHMSGTELAGRMRAVYPHTRILFTSAYTENAIIHQGVLEKGVELLQKPFTPSALARKLREVLDRQASPQPDAVRQANGFTQIIHGGNTP